MGHLLSCQNFGLKTDKLDDRWRNSHVSKTARPGAPWESRKTLITNMIYVVEGRELNFCLALKTGNLLNL
jgi:hypothetical protein